MGGTVRSKAQRVNALTARHGRDPDDPVVLAAREEHALVALTAEMGRRLAGLPPDSRARVFAALHPDIA